MKKLITIAKLLWSLPELAAKLEAVETQADESDKRTCELDDRIDEVEEIAIDGKDDAKEAHSRADDAYEMAEAGMSEGAVDEKIDEKIDGEFADASDFDVLRRDFAELEDSVGGLNEDEVLDMLRKLSDRVAALEPKETCPSCNHAIDEADKRVRSVQMSRDEPGYDEPACRFCLREKRDEL